MPRKSWWARLPFGVRMTAGTGALLIAIGGGAAGISAMTSKKDQSRLVTAVGEAVAAAPAEPGPQPPAHRAPAAKAQFGADAATSRTSDEADRTGTRNPHRKAAAAENAPAPVAAAAGPADTPPSAGAPVVTTRTDVETREIPFQTRTVRDPSLPRGTRQVQTPGLAGEQTLRYLITLTDGRPTARRLLDSTVTRPPQYQVVAFGDRYSPAPAPGPDRRRHCGDALNFCVPLGRAAMCPAEGRDEGRNEGRDEADQGSAGADLGSDEERAVQLGGEVTVQDSGLAVLPDHWGC